MKVKVVPVEAIKAYGGSKGIGVVRALTPLILNLGTRWRREVKFTFRPLYPRERTTVHVKQEDEWARKSVWGVQDKRKLLALVGIRTPGHADS